MSHNHYIVNIAKTKTNYIAMAR